MPQNWLPGDIRDRIRDLCRANNLKQSELAHDIGIDKSTLSRFMSGKTDKLSDTSLQKIAQRLNVSTDFLLGITDISDRKHYAIGELGLTVQAARSLYTHKVDPAIVCELLEHPRFGELTCLLSAYKDELFASGIAAQNQMLSSLSGLVLAQGRAHKDDMYAAYDTAHMLQAQRQPLHVSELDTIQQAFMQIVRDIKKTGPDNAPGGNSAHKRIHAADDRNADQRAGWHQPASDHPGTDRRRRHGRYGDDRSTRTI